MKGYMAIKRGKFIVFEGSGGSGKGTQIKKAKKLLLANGLKVVTTREPGGVPVSEEMRSFIFALKERKLIGSEGQMVLFFAARKFWIDKFVKPNIDNGTSVLSDRCYMATAAYQGYGEGGSQSQILGIADVAVGRYKPDAVILLDISPEASMKRRENPDGDPYDKESVEFFERVIAGYRKMAKTNWGRLNWYMVDGEPEPEVVAEAVVQVLENIFSRKLNRV